ncbi:pimeloyl-ACP methyl ester carboxylesterase [Sporosarcina luteola]|nr:pimeloyl-ACP methyl ester carboxylesterase [Sporosarcina luteola]
MIRYGKWYLLNGVKQYVHVISNNLNNPILIYLHGGPGDAALPLVEHFNDELSEKYTLVIWEQRGSGKSYYKFAENEQLTINDFVYDLKALIDELLVEFKKDKVCLLGHSWGSIIGIKFIMSYPELVHYYIGVGQVISSNKQFEIIKKYVADHTSNENVKNKILGLDITFKQRTWFSDLMFLMNLLIKQGVSLYGKKSYSSLYKYFIFSKSYSLIDCINRLKGSKQSILKLWSDVVQTDFSNDKEFKVPIAFIEGEYDYHASSEVALDFFRKLTSPKLFYCMKDTAHFPQWTRAEAFNTIINSLEISSFSTSNEIKKI